jgi:hypothetical protein
LIEKRTAAVAHTRIDDLLLQVREHVAICSSETRQQNARLKRLEAILVTTGAATIILLISLIAR